MLHKVTHNLTHAKSSLNVEMFHRYVTFINWMWKQQIIYIHFQLSVLSDASELVMVPADVQTVVL